jgi:hypothetical protein
MARTHETLTTGLRGLDRVLKGLLAGDNIVWRVDSVEDYLAVVRPTRRSQKRRLTGRPLHHREPKEDVSHYRIIT